MGCDHTIPTECDLFSDSQLGIIGYLSGSVETWGWGECVHACHQNQSACDYCKVLKLHCYFQNLVLIWVFHISAIQMSFFSVCPCWQVFLLVNGREEYEYFDFFTGDCHQHCPQQWVAYRGSCYSFSTEKKDWNSSRESCRAQGAHLLVISDTWEMVMVFFGFEDLLFPCRYLSDLQIPKWLTVLWLQQYFGFEGEEGFTTVMLHITKFAGSREAKGRRERWGPLSSTQNHPMKDGRRQPSPLLLSTCSPIPNKADMNDYRKWPGTEQSLYSLPTNWYIPTLKECFLCNSDTSPPRTTPAPSAQWPMPFPVFMLRYFFFSLFSMLTSSLCLSTSAVLVK